MALFILIILIISLIDKHLCFSIQRIDQQANQINYQDNLKNANANAQDANDQNKNYLEKTQLHHFINRLNGIIKCNFNHNPCSYSNGLICDYKIGQCICIPGYVKINSQKCFKRKSINQSCNSSIQCHHIKNSACLLSSSSTLSHSFSTSTTSQMASSSSKIASILTGRLKIVSVSSENPSDVHTLGSTSESVSVSASDHSHQQHQHAKPLQSSFHTNKIMNKDKDQWTCQCLNGFWYDKTSDECKEKFNYQIQCSIELSNCKDEFICKNNSHDQNDDKEYNQDNKLECLCPENTFYNETTGHCQESSQSNIQTQSTIQSQNSIRNQINIQTESQNQSQCPFGKQFNKITKECQEAANHLNNNSVDGVGVSVGVAQGNKTSTIKKESSSSSSIKNSKLLRSVSTSSITTPNRDADTDEKILEIILEISFLIVCLLAYQACSKACCPEDNDDDLDIDLDGKSDEESIISGKSPKGYAVKTTRHMIHLTRRKRTRRKTRRVFCKSRTNSTQKLVGSPVISLNNLNNNLNSMTKNQLKDVIVKFDDSSTKKSKNSLTNSSVPCFNCRIYQQVYSLPTARCKLCRIESKLDLDGNKINNNDDDDNTVTANSICEHRNSTSTLSLPPLYKPKQIRRSEEVGVPPHLRAPYVNNQPFWLK